MVTMPTCSDGEYIANGVRVLREWLVNTEAERPFMEFGWGPKDLGPDLVVRVSRGLVPPDGIIRFPIRARFDGLRLVPDRYWVTHVVIIDSGHWSRTLINVESPSTAIYSLFNIFHSRRGRLGIGTGVVASVPRDEDLVVSFTREKPGPRSGVVRVRPNGVACIED